MKIKSLAAALMAGLLTLSLCACGGGGTSPSSSENSSESSESSLAETSQTASEEQEEPESEEPLSITTTESWDFSTGFYPALSSANSNGTMGFTYYARNCYDTLVTREGEEIVPALAETWEISDDGLTYTFHLKEGVKFSDGADLNAEAVKTSIEAAFSNMGDAIAQFEKSGVLTEYVEAVDEYTVVLHLTSPYYGVLSDLAMCNPMAIVSPNAFNEDLTP